MNPFIKGSALGLIALFLFSARVFAQQQAVAEPLLVPAKEVPLFGTYYSLTLLQPPFPFNPFPELPVYSGGQWSVRV